MANIIEEYKCEKCGHTLLKSNKILHDLNCKPNNPLPNNNYNLDNLFNDYSLNNNENIENIYICEICSMKVNAKDKTDHLLCHELENNNNNNNDNDNIFSSFPNYEIFDFSKPNPLPNINININRRNIINSEENEEINDEDEDIDHGDDLSNHSDDLFDEFDNDGLDDAVIQTYPISKIKDINKLDEDKKRCSICLEYYKNNDDSIVLPCIHIFHAECIKKWMKRQRICPICKNEIDA